MGSNIPEASLAGHRPSLSSYLVPTGNKDHPGGALEVSSTASGCGGQHQHTPAWLLVLEGISGERFFLQNLSGSVSSAATAVPLLSPDLLFHDGRGKAPGLLLGPTPSCRDHWAA